MLQRAQDVIAAPEGGPAQRCDLLASDRGGTVEDPDGSLFEARLAYAPAEIEPGSTATFRTAVYAGPKDYDALETFGHSSTNVIDLGWFSFIARGMSWLLRAIYDFVGNWGWSIIIVTLLIKLAFYKLTETSGRSMAKMREIQPRMKANPVKKMSCHPNGLKNHVRSDHGSAGRSRANQPGKS